MAKTPQSNIEWVAWGAFDPMYGVASLEGRNKRGDRPWTSEEFYAYGAQIWAEYRNQWESYGVRRLSCVEIGCGAGRITNQLKSYFQEVHAVDVSPKMIEYAKQHVIADNITFYLTEGSSLPLADCSVTAAFSCDVFQHFSRVSLGEEYLSEVYRVLSSDGSLMIHLPVYTWPDVLETTFSGLYRIWRGFDSIKASTRRFFLKFGVGRPFMFGVKYESMQLYTFLWDLGFRDVEIRFFQNSSEGSRPHFRSYLFARKNQHHS